MHRAKLQLIAPERAADFASGGLLREALENIAGLAGAELSVEPSGNGLDADDPSLPIHYRGEPVGRVMYHPNGGGPAVEAAARTISTLMEHVVGREVAVADLAEEMITSYEELNMLYSLLPSIATRTDETEIGSALVEQAIRALNCRRASLLVLDEARQNFRVLASAGLPDEARAVTIPVKGSIAEHALFENDLLIVNNIKDRPDLQALSKGAYKSFSFAVVRVPLYAQGQAVGILTATDRTDDRDFSAHDQKLLEGLSAMGASSLLNCRLHATVSRQMLNTIKALATAVDAKDHYTHDHAGRVSQLCVATAKVLGITDKAKLREVELAGLLHDVGKIGVADAILSKRDKLTPAEFERIKTHSEIGATIIGHVEGLEGVAQAIRHHHERYDGLGYPDGLQGPHIPIASKIIAVIDTFDALTSDRPYRKAIPTPNALIELRRSKATQLDPEIVDAFVAMMQANKV